MQGRKVDLGWSTNGRVDSSMESYENIISAEKSRQQEEEAVSILPRPRASKNEEKDCVKRKQKQYKENKVRSSSVKD